MPTDMVDEDEVIALLTRLRAELDPALFEAVLRDAGRRRADSLIAHSRGGPVRLVLTHCPMCRALHEPVPTCHFYAGTLEQLLHRLVSPTARVQEVACDATGAAGCEFALAVR